MDKNTKICYSTDRFDRYNFQELSIEELYYLLIDKTYDLFFIGFKEDRYLHRFKLKKIKTKEEFLELFKNNSFNLTVIGLNSGEIDIKNASYIDCYLKYPK